MFKLTTNVFGFDTETYEGYAKILASSDKTSIESTKSVDYIAFLYKKCSFTSLNGWYNLGYDFSAIMKQFFEDNKEVMNEYKKNKRLNIKIQRLEQIPDKTEEENELLGKLRLKYNNTKIKFYVGDYIVSRVGDKSFSIRHISSKRCISFYDVASFFAINSKFISLEQAVSLYLNKHKNAEELKIDASKIGSEEGYYEAYREKIIKYCINDASLTRELFILILKAIYDLGLPAPNKFFSKASITKNVLNNTPSILQDITGYDKNIPAIVKKYAQNSFRGGLFKLNYAGNFNEDVYNLDINSAYPTFIKKINGLTNCKILYYGDKDFKKCFYKFYKIKCKANPLFPTKIKGVLKYVYSEKELIYPINGIDKETIDLYKLKYKIIDGYGILTTDNRIYEKIVNNLFNKKKEIKVKYGKKSFQYMLVKTIANSLYGITAEQHPVQSKFTNFIYASYITSYCRREINKLAYLIEENKGKIISYETDGLIYQLSDHKTINKLNLMVSQELGDIGIERIKEITLFENGIQQQITLDNKIINKTRGFQHLDLELLRKVETITYITKKKVVKKLDSCIIQYKLEDLNKFVDEIKVFNPYRVLSIKYKNDKTLQSLLETPLKDYFLNNFKLNYDTI